MVGRVGTDDLSAIALNDLNLQDVDLSLVAKDEKPTGLAAICVEKKGENIIVVAAGANSNARADQVPDHLLTPESMILLQMEVPSRGELDPGAPRQGQGRPVMLNVAPAAPVPTDIVRMLDWLIVNETEAMIVAESLGRQRDNPRGAASAVAEAAQTTVIVTLGGEGASGFSGDKIYDVNAADHAGRYGRCRRRLRRRLRRGDRQRRRSHPRPRLWLGRRRARLPHARRTAEPADEGRDRQAAQGPAADQGALKSGVELSVGYSEELVILREGGGSTSLHPFARKKPRGWSAFADHDE